MHQLLINAQPKFVKAIEFLQGELNSIRTGRATPTLVEDIPVEAYGAQTPLKGLASINVSDAKTLVIEPWDKNLIKNIESAVRQAGIGINPVVDSQIVRLVMPEMTEENRRDLVKRMKDKIEETRVRIRAAREDLRMQVIQLEKDKAIGQDDRFKLLEEIDKKTKEYNEQVEAIGRKKEVEIMTI